MGRKMRVLLPIAFLFIPPQQQPPATEIYLVQLSDHGRIENGAALTNISNSPGYDNQPSFLPDGSAILFSSQRDGKQMDIYKYTIATRALTQLTNTPEGEYSPTVTPDGKSFSVVRTESDGAQRLWRFDLDGTHPRLVLENVKPVGYHVWIDNTHLALFVLGQPATLQIADTATGTAQIVDSRIGRSLLRDPQNGRVTYVVKPETGHWMIKEIDPKTRAITTLTETADNAGEDLAWHPNGTLLMANGTTIVGWMRDRGWSEIGNLGNSGIERITRLAVDPSPPIPRWLALVAQPKPAG